MSLRCISDTLDGAVARKYHKVTEIGGYLDTISDFIYYIMMYHYIMILKLGLHPLFNFIGVCTYFYVIYTYDSFSNHEKLKTYGTTLTYRDIMPFLVNNSVIPFMFIFLVICKIM